MREIPRACSRAFEVQLHFEWLTDKPPYFRGRTLMSQRLRLSLVSVEQLVVLPWDSQVGFDWQPDVDAQALGGAAPADPPLTFASPPAPTVEKHSTTAPQSRRTVLAELPPGRYAQLYELLTNKDSSKLPGTRTAATARQPNKEELRKVWQLLLSVAARLLLQCFTSLQLSASCLQILLVFIWHSYSWQCLMHRCYRCTDNLPSPRKPER